MIKKGKIRFMAQDEVELEQIKCDLKVIRLALLQEILKQAKSLDPDPNLIARLSSIYLKVAGRLEKMIRDIPAEEVQDEIENDGDIVPAILNNSADNHSPQVDIIPDDEYPPSLRNNGPANERRCAVRLRPDNGTTPDKLGAALQTRDIVPSRLDNSAGDSAPDCHCEESHLEGRRSNLRSDNTGCHGDPSSVKSMFRHEETTEDRLRLATTEIGGQPQPLNDLIANEQEGG
jgi:hypothetical protein